MHVFGTELVKKFSADVHYVSSETGLEFAI